MKKLTIYLSIFLLFGFLFILGGCQGGLITPSTPTPGPTSAPTSAPSTGSISGIITEKGTGTPLEGVTITVDGSTTVITASDGSYSIPNLSPGFHTLKFEKVGYKTETGNVNVTTGSDTPYAVEMENTTQTIELPVLEDSYIFKTGLNYGSLTEVAFGAIVAGFDARMLFKFWNLSPGEKVISAKLKLYKEVTIPLSGLSVPYEVYPLKEDWEELAVTWTQRTTAFPWFEEGGNYDKNAKVGEGEFTLGGVNAWEEVDITEIFNYWEGGNPNYGIIIISKQNTTSLLRFASKDNPSSAFRPYVEVEYYTP